MSESYECVVFPGDETLARAAFAAVTSSLRLRLVHLAEEVFAIYRVAGRQEAFDPIGIEKVTSQVSAYARLAAAFWYDNGCGVRAAVQYAAGSRARSFGQADEWWVPVDEVGVPILNGPRLRSNELRVDEEYDCIYSAIDAGLEAAGVSAPVSGHTLKEACCYGKFGWLADAPGRG